MKKLTLIIVIAVIFLTTAGAAAQSNVRFGAKAGLNLASEVAGEDSSGTRTGIYAGLFVECKVGNKVDLQPELLYSMQGGGGDKIDYINIPLMVKIYVNKARSLSIDVGPQIGYMISAKYSEGGETLDFYDFDGVKKVDVSLGIGISWKWNEHFDLGARFLGGLTKIAEGMDNRHSVAQLGVGYRF